LLFKDKQGRLNKQAIDYQRRIFCGFLPIKALLRSTAGNKTAKHSFGLKSNFRKKVNGFILARA
jgi:hypothetical protein